MITSHTVARVNSILSPALFAARVSRGEWKLARHLAAIDRAIMETILGKTAPILVVEAPPRHGKSELVSRYLPAWYLGLFPARRVMLAGYGSIFARAWGRKARALLTEFGPEYFGVTVNRAERAASEWGVCGAGGGMVTAGIGGPMTGRGANLLIVDDPIKNAEQADSQTIRDNHWDWWQSTASTRIEPGGCAIIIATRWHHDDLSGRLIQAAERGDGAPVRRLRLPAIAEEDDALGRNPGEALWPARWPIERLERTRQQKDPEWWQAMYQQRPGSASRTTWPNEYFERHIWTERFPGAVDLSVLAVDPSKGRRTGDYSAVVFVGLSGGRFWIDASIDRRPPEKTVSDAIDMAARYVPHAVVIEANAFQYLLAPEFDRQCRERRIPPLPLHLVDQRTSKEARISQLGPYLMRQELRLLDTPGCRLLVQQLRNFPLSDHDDGPDALELAIRTLRIIANPARDDASLTLEYGSA